MYRQNDTYFNKDAKVLEINVVKSGSTVIAAIFQASAAM